MKTFALFAVYTFLFVQPSISQVVCNPSTFDGCFGQVETPALPTEIIPAPPPYIWPENQVNDAFGPLDPAVTTQAWVNEVAASCDARGQLHYRASVESISQWMGRALVAEFFYTQTALDLDQCLNPVVVGPQGCSSVGTFVDGSGGALWKPISDNTGLPVILMPIQFKDAALEIVSSQNVLLGAPRFRTISNGNRPHWDVFFPLEPNITVKFILPSGFIDCRTVPNPSERYD